MTTRLSRELARIGFVSLHDRGRVFANTAVLIADGGRVLSDLSRGHYELAADIDSRKRLATAFAELALAA